MESATSTQTASEQVAPGKLEHGKLVSLNPTSLEVHPSLVDFPELSPDQFALLKEDIRATERVIEPLIINGQRQIIDGRHRHRAALLLELKRIPCLVDDTVDPLTTALASAVARRQLTKSGIALVLFERHPQLCEERKGREKSGLIRRNPNTVSVEQLAKKLELPSFVRLASRYRIPNQYFSYLALIWDSTTPEEWADIKSAIASEETGLPQLYSGIRSRIKTKGGKRTQPDSYKLLEQTLTQTIPFRLRAWEKLSATQKDKLVDGFCSCLDKLPMEFCTRIANRLTEHVAPETTSKERKR